MKILLRDIFVWILIEELCDEVNKYEFPVALHIKDYFSLYVLQFFHSSVYMCIWFSSILIVLWAKT
jgi:hypothetical protein